MQQRAVCRWKTVRAFLQRSLLVPVEGSRHTPRGLLCHEFVIHWSAQAATAISSPNLDLVPCIDDEKVICGAVIPMATPDATPLVTLHDQADRVLQEWLTYMVDWVAVAVHQATDEKTTKDDLTLLLLVRRGDVVCWGVEALCEHVDILGWLRESGSVLFPSISALAHVWLGRAPSNVFQERVFSTGGIVMSSLRSRTDNHRAEMQVLLKHNRTEIQRMEAGSTTSAAVYLGDPLFQISSQTSFGF